MIKRATTLLVAALLCLPVVASAQLAAYSQDFEGLVQADPGALSGDNWKIFANVFAPDGVTYLYGYGVFPAPNGGPPYAFSTIAAGEGGVPQGAQQLVAFSDYNNGDHAVGNVIEANLFQEQVIAAGDVGTTWMFSFDAKHGDLSGNSTALAFIKTLDPNNGFQLSNFLTVDMTGIPAAWNTYSLGILIDAGLVGHILQIGFLNKATYYEPSGTFYDNINWDLEPVIATEPTTWSGLKTRFER